MRTKLFMRLLAIVFATTIGLTQAATYKLATNVSEDSLAGRLIAEFVEKVSERTGGKVKFKIFANGVLGEQMQYFQQIQKGIIDAGLVNSAALENVIPAIGVLNLPYIFRTSEEYNEVIGNLEVRRVLFESAAAHNFMPLGFIASGFRSIYTTKPVKSAQDLKGMKLRTMSSETYIEMLKLFGAVPTPLPFGELYSGLQMGVVDGAEGGLAGVYEAKFGEVAKYAVRTEQTRLTDLVVTSLKFHNKLTPEESSVIQEEFAKISAKSVSASDEHEARQTGLAATEMGVKIVDIDKEPLLKAVEPMYKQALKDKEKAPLLKAIFDIEGRTLSE